MELELKKLNKLIAIKIKQDLGEGLSQGELQYVQKIINGD
tara:strand:+ start:4459 stop:4578 length:120 start_codon:yes stop_codon:yes gene_type:complete